MEARTQMEESITATVSMRGDHPIMAAHVNGYEKDPGGESILEVKCGCQCPQHRGQGHKGVE
eukprot:99418-Hanusia_phi.AAC.1